MKNLSLLVFAAALAIGLAFSISCGFSSLRGVQGSGTAKTETRTVGNFTKIDVGGAINVEVAVQKDFSVVVEADDNLLANIKTETSGDTLKIYSENSISPKTRINVKISMPKLEKLDVSGASNGIVTNVNADSLDLKASGASKIKIEGIAKKLNADASGASTVDAENLKAEDANVEASGASSSIVNASNELKADASGASKITYVGEPKNLKQNSSGGSSVNKK